MHLDGATPAHTGTWCTKASTHKQTLSHPARTAVLCSRQQQLPPSAVSPHLAVALLDVKLLLTMASTHASLSANRAPPS